MIRKDMTALPRNSNTSSLTGGMTMTSFDPLPELAEHLPELPEQQLTMLHTAVRESSRRSTVQLSGAFAYGARSAPPPLARLVKMGEPALKVYLTLVLATRTSPHELYRGTSAARYARMLGYDASALDDSTSNGTRRCQRALASLHKSGFIKRTHRPGRVDHILVNHFDQDMKPPYVTFPLDLWRNGWINRMSLGALVIYTALRRECAGNETEPIYVEPFRRQYYGFSDELWVKGASDLAALRLLSIAQEVAGDRDAHRRRRTVYRLTSVTMVTEG